jgi:anaerobic selenocysteine-containing dehydrogenase
MERREFIILTAAGTAGALALQGCGTNPEDLKPLYIANDRYTPGADYWRATVCRECPAGCGIIVRVRDGQANKIEGNPLHPISRGKTCARGQAGLNALYNPDRITHPLKRTGPRGSGQFERIEWDEAINSLAEKLGELRARDEGRSIAWIEGGAARSALSRLIAWFLQNYGTDKLFIHHPFSREIERHAARLSFREAWLPTYDLARADYVLSFGARFLETWGSPVFYSRAFGEMRRGRRVRGRFVHAEPRMSLTAANADEWLPVRPGAEGQLALSIAHEAIQNPFSRPPHLEAFAPEKVAETTGIAPATIRRIAKELAEAEAVVVLGGDAAAAHSNGIFNLLSISYLRGLFRGATSRLHYGWWPAEKPLSATPGAMALGTAFAAQAAEIKALFIHQANPLYSAPAALNLGAAFEKIPLIVSFSSFEDETASYADLILPAHTPLEEWSDDYPEQGVLTAAHSLAQPVVEPLYQTRHVGDVLLALSQKVKPGDPANFPDLLKQSVLEKHGGASSQAERETFWEQTILRGGVWNEEATAQRIEPAVNISPDKLLPTPAQFAGDEKDFPLHFLPYEHLALGDGRAANHPLLQELPDPMTAVSWGSWVEINPQTAAQLGIRQGDLVKIESPHGELEAPAVLYPAIRPDTVAMPAGQGHERYGRYATGRGANPLKILAPLTEPQTGALAWAATRVRISKAAGTARLIAFGTDERMLEKQEQLKR